MLLQQQRLVPHLQCVCFCEATGKQGLLACGHLSDDHLPGPECHAIRRS